MLSPLWSVLLIPLLVAMFLAVNMGASGTAPAFSAAYGANLIRREMIPGIFGIVVFAGALLAGKRVSLTIGRGIIPAELLTVPMVTIVLLAVGLSLLAANLLRIPQSTSQATVFALAGPGLYFGRFSGSRLWTEIIPTWFILPVIAFAVTWLLGRFIYRPLQRRGALRFEQLAGHPVWRGIVIGGSLYVAFAIGSNNVANAAGPIAAMMGNELGLVPDTAGFGLILIAATLVVAPCFGIGSSLMGSRVLETTGRQIVTFGPMGATLIAVVTASLLLVASLSRGIPTSLVQMNVAAILALGIVKEGWRPILSRSALPRLVTVWIIAPLIAMALSTGLTALADRMGWL